MFGNLQSSSNQPLELPSSGDEKPLQLEGGENQEEEETNWASEEEGEEAEPSVTSSASPRQSPLQEDELAQILANMCEYMQPQSPLNLNIEAEKSKEHYIHNKDTYEEMHDEEEAEAEAPKEIADQTRVSSPEEPSQGNANTEEVFQIENVETSQDKGTVPE